MNPFSRTLFIILVIAGLADALRRLAAGPLNASALLTMLVGTCTYGLVLLRARLPKSTTVVAWLVLFLVFAITSWYWNLPTAVVSNSFALQNLLVYLGFVGLILLSAIESDRSPGMPNYLVKGLGIATAISVILYGIGVIKDGSGASTILGNRAFALVALILLAWNLAAWRYGNRRAFWWAVALLVLIGLSSSRTAMLISLILFPLSQVSLSPKGVFRMGVWVLTIFIVAQLALNFVEPIRERFKDTGDSGQIAGIKVNTSGREVIWTYVQASAAESPFIGRGPGSVSQPVQAANKTANGHPHNDYLRIQHDFGYLGLSLWGIGYTSLVLKCLFSWLKADRLDRETAAIHLAAFMGLLANALAMLTDNCVVYIFVMNPLAILVGASLGTSDLRRKARVVAQQQQAWLSQFYQQQEATP